MFHSNHVCDVAVLQLPTQIQTDTYVLELRAYVLVCANGLTIRCKDFIVTNSSGAMNDSKRPVAVSLNALSVFDNALTMF